MMHQFHRLAIFPRKARVLMPVSAASLGLVIVVLAVLPGSGRVSQPPVSARDISLLSGAGQILIRQCMKREGFEYWPIPESQVTPAAPSPYALTSISRARTHGFAGGPVMTAAGADPNERYFSHLPAGRQNTYSNALVGVGPGGPAVTVASPLGGVLGHSSQGCQAKAEAQLYGSFPAWFRASSVAEALPAVTQAMVLEDARYRQSVSGWSECMAAKGYAYANPGQAAAAFRRPASARPGRLEIRAAVAEVRCADSTGLATVTSRLNRVFSAAVARSTVPPW